MIKFVVILIINTILTGLYLIGHLTGILGRRTRQVRRSDAIMRTIIMLLCPVVGVVIFLGGFLIREMVFRKEVNLGDVVFSKERVKTYSFADEEKERNLVPLQDAIEITDTDNLRNLMMTIVSGDIRQTLATISMALNSSDSETSHYAAAVLQESLDTFRDKVQSALQEIAENPEEKLGYAREILDSMDPVLRQRVFKGAEQENMVLQMEELGELIWKTSPRAMSSEELESICMRLLEIQKYDLCDKWCERQDYIYPDILATYTCKLKLYFNTGKRNKFFYVLDELKKSNIVVDSETLELIRVFM